MPSRSRNPERESQRTCTCDHCKLHVSSARAVTREAGTSRTHVNHRLAYEPHTAACSRMRAHDQHQPRALCTPRATCVLIIEVAQHSVTNACMCVNTSEGEESMYARPQRSCCARAARLNAECGLALPLKQKRSGHADGQLPNVIAIRIMCVTKLGLQTTPTQSPMWPCLLSLAERLSRA